MDQNKISADAQEYFTTLPKNVQEAVMQSSISFDSLEDLQSFVTNWQN